MLQERLSPRKSPSQARSRETVEVVLEATDQLVSKGGLAAVRMREVARRAGVSPGTLYQYFATRDSLLVAWEERQMVRRAESFVARLAEVTATSPHCEASIRALVDAAVDLIAEHVAPLREAGAHDLLSRYGQRMATHEAVIELVAGVLRAASTRERLRVRNAEAAARVIVKCVFYLGYDLAAAGPASLDRGQREEIADMLVCYLLRERVQRPS
jgi:AcrR family transcriptional regulator